MQIKNENTKNFIQQFLGNYNKNLNFLVKKNLPRSTFFETVDRAVNRDSDRFRFFRPRLRLTAVNRGYGQPFLSPVKNEQFLNLTFFAACYQLAVYHFLQNCALLFLRINNFLKPKTPMMSYFSIN